MFQRRFSLRILPALSVPLLFAPPSAAAPASQGFVERAAEVGLVHEIATGFDKVGLTQLFDWTQRGMALGDIDGDGDVDLLACGGVLTNSLLRNDGGVFIDVTAGSGLELGDLDSAPAFADVDRDGDLDVYIGVMAVGGLGGPAQGRGRMYLNDGTGVFTEVSTLAGTHGSGHTLFAQWVDMDLDGLLDLIAAEFFTTENHFYRNNGDGTFRDMSVELGLNTGGSTHVTCVLDVDGDGLLDLLTGNDYIVSQWPGLPNNVGDLHHRGLPDGTWLDVSDGSDFYVERGIMGYALGDVDYDGDLDVYRTDIDANHMVINRGWPTGAPWLAEEQDYYGIAAAEVPWPSMPGGVGKGVGWGAVFLDADFDLWLDLFLVNGQVGGFNTFAQFSPRYQPNFLWTGDGPGAGFTFTDRSDELGPFGEIDDRVVVTGDLDQDGDLDLVVGPTTGFVRYYENQIDRAGQGWLLVDPVCNTSGAGGFGVIARFDDSLGYPHVRQIGLDGVTAGQHENIAYFGLGNEPSVDLFVEFPSGITLEFPGTTPNQRVQAVEPELIRTSARTTPIASSPTVGSARLASWSVPDGLYWVTAFAHAQDGTPLDSTADVVIDTPGLVPLTPVLPLGAGVFRRYYLKPTVPGSYRSRVAFDGWEVKIQPRVHFFDPTDISGTDAQLIPEAVRAGSADTFEVVVAPKDANGISLGAGNAVSVILGANPPASATDLGNGSYAIAFDAPATAGVHALAVLVNGVPVPGLALNVEAGGITVGAQSGLQKMQPSQTQSAAPHQLKVMLQPRDGNGWRLGPFADVQMVATPDVGSAPVTVRTDLHPVGIRNGEHMFVMEKPLTDPPTPAAGMLQFFVDGAMIGQVTYDY